NAAELILNTDSLYGDSFIWAKAIASYPAKQLYPVTEFAQLEPRGLPVKSKASLVFHYPPSIDHPEKLSIYSWNRITQRWVSLPAPVDQEKHTVQTNIDYLDVYALLYDNVPPEISAPSPCSGCEVPAGTQRLASTVRDIGMLIDDSKLT